MKRKLEKPEYKTGDYVLTLEPDGSIGPNTRSGRYRRGRVESVMEDTGCGVAYIVKLTPRHSIVSKHPWMKRGRKFDLRRAKSSKEERETARILREFDAYAGVA